MSDDTSKSRTATIIKSLVDLQKWLINYKHRSLIEDTINHLHDQHKLILTARRDALDEAIADIKREFRYFAHDPTRIDHYESIIKQLKKLRDNPPKERGEG